MAQLSDEKSFNLTVEEFMKFASITSNKDMPASLKNFASNMNYSNRKVKPTVINKWRDKEEQPKNWLLNNDQTDEEKTYSHIKGILNKLSDKNYDELSKELLSIKFDTSKQILKLVELIFEKAVVEQTYSTLYSKLCAQLSTVFTKTPDREESFKEVLISKCQTIFEEGLCFGEKDNQSEFGIKLFKFKENLFGFLIFLGELYNQSLLTSNVINSCLNSLLDEYTEKKTHSIECLCNLLTTIGDKFFSCEPDLANTCFNKLISIKDSSTINIRDKFSIMDLIDIREKNSW